MKQKSLPAIPEKVLIPLNIVTTTQEAVTRARHYIEQVSVAIHGLARHSKDSNMERILVELRATEEGLRLALREATKP